ncbi:MAG: hypothetical protein D6704_05260 [Nitrospirae bacterium]|nr:MAG: hypothetical protein D6704_05260 [Nitrospirota bacterium]
MKSKPKSLPNRTSRNRTTRVSAQTTTQPARTVPRCPRCGSRTVRLDQLRQELLMVFALHCLICGHHAFIGKPIVRLIRKPEISSTRAVSKPSPKA